MAADIANSRLVVIEECGHMSAAGEAGRSLGRARRWLSAMTTVYAREDYLGADEYIDVVAKSGLNRPIEDRGRVERMLEHANLIVTARQDGRLVGFARSLTDFCFCCYLSDLAVDKACQGQGIGKRLIEETRTAGGRRARPRPCCCRRRRR